MTFRLPPLDARIPPWNLDELVPRPCPYCGTAAGEPNCIRPDGLTVRECRQCGAFFVSPAPTEAQLANFYAHYDQDHRSDAPMTPAELLVTYRNRGPLYDFRVRELSSMMAFEGKRVLDVGFGRAHFMWCLQSLGADVHGIELDDEAIAIARELGITKVRKATIDACADDQPYDLIVLNDVVEHPLEPRKLLHACADLLAPGGVMLIWTPNGGAARGTAAPVTFRVDLEHMQYSDSGSVLDDGPRPGPADRAFRDLWLPDPGEHRRRRWRNGSSAVKRVARSVPGLVRTVHRIREWTSPSPDERFGAYHLFCIYQKPRGSIDRQLPGANQGAAAGARQPGGAKG